MTELTVAEVPAVVVVELECRLGPGGDLADANEYAAARSPAEHRHKCAVRKVVHLRARSLPGVSSRSRIVRVERRAPERPGPWADRDEDLTRRREGLAEVRNGRGEWPVDGIDVGRRPTHRLR